jgi:hypothetical protein
MTEHPDLIRDRSWRRRGRKLAEHAATGFIHYYLGTIVVVLGAYLGFTFVAVCPDRAYVAAEGDLLRRFAAWDGFWYSRIASEGYSYDPRRWSTTAFFPVYPWCAGFIRRVLQVRTELALLIVSHTCLWTAFIALFAYVRARFPNDGSPLADRVLLIASLFPTTFFFRMTYSEAMFFLLAILAMYGMVKSWHPLWVAIVIGAATGTRSVGVALLAPFWVYLWQRASSRRQFVALAAALTPITCWGLVMYIGYLAAAFGEPLAFVSTQVHWSYRQLTFTEQALGFATLEPARAVYDPESICYWSRNPPRGEPLLNLTFANPLYVLLAIVALAFGWAKRWLDRRELLLSVMLLLIPLWMQAGRTCMDSQARYAAVIFPVYIVLAKAVMSAGFTISAGLLAMSAVLLCLYSAMFASWHWFY